MKSPSLAKPSRPGAGPELLRFDDLDSMLLLKNGNYLYKVPFRGGEAVLKVYYGSRPASAYVLKSLGNLLLANQTSVMPKARRETELECLRVWREAGFRVFGTYDDVIVEGQPEGGYTLFEYVPAQTFVQYFRDRSIALDARLATWRRFLRVWHRRHRLAIDRRDPRLIHENGDLKHVMMLGDEFLFFDFETRFRSRNRIWQVTAREILCYLKSMARTVQPDELEAFLAETVRHYPGQDLLDYTYEFAFRDPNPLVRLGRAIERRTASRAKKPSSKYSVAARLREMRLHRSAV